MSDGKITVVLVNGVPTSGKDTFIKFCMKYAYRINNATHVMPKINMHSMSLIDYDKNILRNYYEWDGEKTPEVRQILSMLQVLGMKNNIQINDLVRNIFKLYSPVLNNIFFIQARRDIHLCEICDTLTSGKYKKYDVQIKSVYMRRNNTEVNSDVTDADAEAANSRFVYDKYIDNDKSLNMLELDAIDYVDSIL